MCSKYLYYSLLWLFSNGFLPTCAQWRAEFTPSAVEVTMATSKRGHVTLWGLSEEITGRINDRTYVRFGTENAEVARVDYQDNIEFFANENSVGSLEAYFEISGIFIGNNKCTIH